MASLALQQLRSAQRTLCIGAAQTGPLGAAARSFSSAPFSGEGNPYTQHYHGGGDEDPSARRGGHRGSGGGFGGGDRGGFQEQEEASRLGGRSGGGGFDRRQDFGGGGHFGGRRFQQGGDSYKQAGSFQQGGSQQGGGFERDRAPLLGGGPDRMGGVGQNLKQLNWQEETLVNIQKNFYVEHPEVAAMSEAQVVQAMQQLNANIEGRQPHPKPLVNWGHLSLPADLLSGINAAGFERPTAIQSIGWPAALSGRDLVGVAQTGSGKTLAFLMPMLVHIRAQPELRPGDGPLGLIMAPTRELAMQIQGEVNKFTQMTGLRCSAAFGGVSRYGQASELRRGVEILVATPGRLLDFLESGVTNLKRVTYLCLDEADRMLDMGFEPQIRKLVSQIRPDRQTLMYSATWPKEIQRLARDFCKEDPIKLTIGSEGLSTNADITQQIEVVGEYEKRERFMNWIRGPANENKKVLVFTETKRGADALCRELQHQQMSAAAIHGDKEQRQRDSTIADFKSGRTNILIATDVAQRGLDIKDVAYVVNYDIPKTLEDYIHRIGRTGRAGAKGTAVTFFPAEAYSPDMIRMARKIAQSMREVGQSPPDKLLQLTGGRH